MDYLRLIQTFRQLGGKRQAFTAPNHPEPILTIPLQESRINAHFVVDMALAKQVLQDAETYRQDRFLDELLKTCDLERCNWIQLFVSKSPEFLDGTVHTELRRTFDNHISRYTKLIQTLPVSDITSRIRETAQNPHATSTHLLARQIIGRRITQILEQELGVPPQVPEALLYVPDFFTPSIKIKSVVYRLNALITSFVEASVPAEVQSDEPQMLAILSLFLMASRPLVAACTSLLNQVQQQRSMAGRSSFLEFAMVPTFYVAREASQPSQLGDQLIQPGDKLYVFLYESTGCPFRRGISLPFGHGRHRCPGAPLSKVLMQQCLHACEALEGQNEIWDKLIPSAVQQDLANTFLTYSG